MPNIATNRLRVFGANNEQLAEIARIFDTHAPFNELIPQPDWANTPNDEGVLPTTEIREEGGVTWETRHFNGRDDDRWYDWCVQHWGTKWEAMTEMQVDATTWWYETAWDLPMPWLAELGRRFPDVLFVNVARIEGEEKALYAAYIRGTEGFFREGPEYDQIREIVSQNIPEPEPGTQEHEDWNSDVYARTNEIAENLVAAELAGAEELFAQRVPVAA